MTIKLPKLTTASLDVDCQKGFTPLCPKELPVPDGDKIVDELHANAVLTDYRMGSKDAHCREAIWIADKEHHQYDLMEDKNSNMRWNKHCIMGTKGAELLDGLPHPDDYDFFVWKGIEPDMHPYGACFHDLLEKTSTGLIEYIDKNSIGAVIVGGLATDYCVKTTVLQLASRAMMDLEDTYVIVNLAACRGIDKETTDKAIKEMNKWKQVIIAKDHKEIEAMLS